MFLFDIVSYYSMVVVHSRCLGVLVGRLQWAISYGPLYEVMQTVCSPADGMVLKQHCVKLLLW